MRRGPLRHTWFAAFTASVGLGSIADEVSRLALPLLVLDLTHSLAAAAAVRVVQLVPYLAFGSFAGVLIDRSDKRRLLIAADVVGFAVTAALPLSLPLGVFSLELVYVIAFLLGAIDVVRGVAMDFGVVPALVEEHELTQANAIYLGADRSARVIGPVIAGFAIQAFGSVSAFWFATLAFVPTAIVLLRMPVHLLAADVAERAPLRPGVLMREVGDGFAYVWRSPILKAVVVFMTLSNIGGTGVQTVVIYTLTIEQGVSASTLGLIFSVIGLMSILGSVGAPALTRGRPMGRTTLFVQVVAALATFAMAGVRETAGIVLAFAARQLASAAWIVYVFTPRQREVPAAIRGRANGAFRTIVLTSNAASPALLSTIQASFGTPAAFGVAGTFALIALVYAARSPFRDYDVRSPDELARLEPAAEIEERAEDPTAVP